MKILTILFLAFALLFAKNSISLTQKQQNDLGIKTTKISKANHVEFGSYNGVVVMDNKDFVSLSLNVDSTVKEIFVREFEHVKKGQKLLSISSYELLNIQSEFINTLLEYDLVEKNLQRDSALFQEGIISQKRVLVSQKEKLNAELKVNSLQNRLFLGGLNMELIAQIKKTHVPKTSITIVAPISGVISKIDAKIAQSNPMQKMLMEISGNGSRFLEFEIPSNMSKDISIGDICLFDEHKTSITAISNIVNPTTQSVQVRAILKNAKSVLINKVYKTTVQKSVKNAFVVKKSSVVFYKNMPHVFVKNSGGFNALGVKIVSEDAQNYTIKAAIKDDSELASEATSALLTLLESSNE